MTPQVNPYSLAAQARWALPKREEIVSHSTLHAHSTLPDTSLLHTSAAPPDMSVSEGSRAATSKLQEAASVLEAWLSPHDCGCSACGLLLSTCSSGTTAGQAETFDASAAARRSQMTAWRRTSKPQHGSTTQHALQETGACTACTYQLLRHGAVSHSKSPRNGVEAQVSALGQVKVLLRRSEKNAHH